MAMMYQLRDLRVRYLPASTHGDATWSMETQAKCRWYPVPYYHKTFVLELQELAERSVKRTPGTYKLPIEADEVKGALAALFDEFQAIEEVDE